MSLSHMIRPVLVAGLAVWLAAPAALGLPPLGPVSDRAPQGDSPIPNPLDSPIAVDPSGSAPAPLLDPAVCSPLEGCVDGATSTPVDDTGFRAFLPGAGQQPDQSASQPPGASPDLGTLLNYAAIAIVVIGLSLKAYWFFADRRRAK